MRETLGLLGLCLIAFGGGWYLYDLKTGVCAVLVCLGAGLILDALRK